MAFRRKWFACFMIAVLALVGCDFRLNPRSLPTSEVKLPFDRANISFDDLQYDAHTDRLIVPAAETGALALVDPLTRSARLVQGFSAQTNATPVVGTTSATVVGSTIFALDRAAKKIQIVDVTKGQIVGSTDLQDVPDYIRYIAATNELWITERASEQIEVFKLDDNQPPDLTAEQPISVPGGPEALVIYQSGGMAFTNQPKLGTTAVIYLLTRRVRDHWGNGCTKARGMAVDEQHGLLFVACGEGKVVVMDINQDGAQVTSQTYGGSLDFVAYNPTLKHLYLPSAASGIVAIYGVTDAPAVGKPTLTPTGLNVDAQEGPTPTPATTPAAGANIRLNFLGTADTAVKARCVTTDSHDNIWICDPNHGQLLVVKDTFPASTVEGK